ncbi:MAG: 4'-phosphopantetheinyl transferase superfamily protein [Thermodesulfobacteriota bacterium]|nr:4'-phosphopantetheinyl transferase superfamily protein [Thermodesulfobacteriota bacterium]
MGNDVVDLLSPYVKGKSGDRKFVQRVLTPREHQALLKYDAPDNLLQIYWAAKETAYKVILKSCPDVSSAPRQYNVYLDTPENGRDFQGWVHTPRRIVHITARQNKDFVHCVGAEACMIKKTVIHCVENISHRIEPDVCRYSDVESRMVRTSAKRKIASILSVSEHDITITNVHHENGRLFPAVDIRREKTGISISMSHDGRFIAYAFLIQS